MRRKLIAGNWKMHNTLPEARALLKGIRERFDASWPIDAAICPPFTLLYPMGKEIDGTSIRLGAQNCHHEQRGAFTGEISPTMLKAAGCTYVIIGHSERRHGSGESGELLRKKVWAALAAGLEVIYCLGETLDERRAGRTQDVVARQLDEAIHATLDASKLVLGYEPVWAIGTGQQATPEQAQEMHAYLRGRLTTIFDAARAAALRILYGGSVKAGNAAGLLSCPDVDGALVGGACLDAVEFTAIMSSAARLQS
jgi:triosephosphate isomerase